MHQFNDEELHRLANAVQWAGHFATLLGDCKSNGPAFGDIAAATRAIEARGGRVYHSRAARAMVEASA